MNSPTSTTATLNIDAGAAPGARNVALTTGNEVATLASGFTVMAVTAFRTISTISPNTAKRGRAGPLTIVGLNTHFVQGTSTLDLGTGITISNVQVTCSTCLAAQVSISNTAPPGPHNVIVSTGTEIATPSHVQVSESVIGVLLENSGGLRDGSVVLARKVQDR